MRKTVDRMVSVLLCMAMVLCILPQMGSPAEAVTGYDRGYNAGMEGSGQILAHGLDVSAWQESGLDFQNIANAGYDYVILRIGTSVRKDVCFEEYYTNAKAAGLDVGCYFYSYATTVAEAQQEARDVVSWMQGKCFEYPIYFDFEDPTQVDLDYTLSANICRGFMDILKDNGYLAGLYSMSWILNRDWVYSSGIYDTYEGWVAHVYSEAANTGITSNEYNIYKDRYCSVYGMHQYSFTTYVNGVGPFDANVAYKDYPTIMKTYGFNGYKADNWEWDSVGWKYKHEDGTYAVGWTKIDDNWYYFSASTYMYTGWYYDEGYQGWYFFDPTSGIMQTGFVYSEGYHYYMDSTGRMLEGWQKIDGYWYYFNTTEYWPLGAMFTGWHEIDGEYYFFSEVTGDGRGRMQTGWVAVGTDWYYCNADGVRQYGWQNIDNAWYYLTEPNGIMAERTWVEKDGEQWYVNASGAHTEGAAWTVGDTYEGALDIGTEFYATIDIPGTGTRAGVDSDETSATYKNLEVQAVREVEDENYHEQLWYFVRREDGSYRITNVATGLCLDVEGGYVEPGTNVRVWNGNDAIAQRWFVYQEGDNYGMVSACNAWDKTVLDVADGLAEEGTNIRIWTHNGSVAQQFMVTKVVEEEHTEHIYEALITEPTCTEQGYTAHTCVCGESYVDSYVAALEHKYSDWYTTKDATCTQQGEEQQKCERCEHYKTRPIPAKGHSYEAVVIAPVCTEQGYTLHSCACGDSYQDAYIAATGHHYSYQVGDTPTVSAAGSLIGTCKDCSDTTIVTLPKLNASDYAYTIELEPTATTAGIGRYTTNAIDGETFYFDVEISPTGTGEFKLGDVDYNGVINATDYLRVKAAFLGERVLSEAELLAADVDQNGVIDATDYLRIKAYFLGNYVIE